MRAVRSILLLGLVASAPATAGELPARQQEIFQLTCAHCHARPRIGVPQVGDAEAWRERASVGLETLVARTVLGHRDMPPLGTCGFCTEEDLRLLVGFLAGLD